MRLGSTVLPALLLEESADGLALLIGGTARIAVNQKGEVRTSEGWFKVRIVHATPVSPCGAATAKEGASDAGRATMVTTEDARTVAGAEQGPYFRVGVQCLRRIVPPPSACLAAN